MPNEFYDSRLEPYLTKIGQLVATYAELEFHINDAIWELSNVERMVGNCMTAQMIGPGPRNRCMLALLKYRSAEPSLLEEFNKIAKKIEGLAAQRNRYVHDPLVIGSAHGTVARIEATADRHSRLDFIPAELAKIDKLARDIQLTVHDFDMLYLRALAELPAWPRTQFERSEGIEVRRKDRKNDD